jgi:hypothetical protein
MQDGWYGDKRDLIKWGVLLRLADFFQAKRILQLTFYRPTKKFGPLIIDGQEDPIPPEVIAHFRNVRAIQSLSSSIKVTVFDSPFQERDPYLQAVLAFLSAFRQECCVVFLDPDTVSSPSKHDQHSSMSSGRKRGRFGTR